MEKLLLSFQDKLIPNSAWKDYASNTNYAFDHFSETEEKPTVKGNRNGNRNGGNTNGPQPSHSREQTLQMSHSPSKTQYYEHQRNGNGRQNGDHR